MYKDYNVTQLTLPMKTSVFIPVNDISRHVNNIVETILETEFYELRHHRGCNIIPFKNDFKRTMTFYVRLMVKCNETSSGKIDLLYHLY